MTSTCTHAPYFIHAIRHVTKRAGRCIGRPPNFQPMTAQKGCQIMTSQFPFILGSSRTQARRRKCPTFTCGSLTHTHTHIHTPTRTPSPTLNARTLFFHSWAFTMYSFQVFSNKNHSLIFISSDYFRSFHIFPFLCNFLSITIIYFMI